MSLAPRVAAVALVASCLLVGGCGEETPPPDAGPADLAIGPRAATCHSKDTSQTCAIGEYCITFEGGGLRCQELPAACLERATCACKPPLPNGTCGCKDDGAGRIVVDCH